MQNSGLEIIPGLTRPLNIWKKKCQDVAKIDLSWWQAKSHT